MLAKRQLRHGTRLLRPSNHLIEGGVLGEIGQEVSRHPGVRARSVRRHGQGVVEDQIAPVAQHLV